ncbi:MAG: tandem-95 repeat protein, partial [Planctomycetes bacterium]|nr:tandem-95 repeat protein [Planctomycetota bacterium]
VTGVNDAPVASDESYFVGLGDTLVVNSTSGVLSNDADIDGDVLNATIVSDPVHGEVILNLNGSFSYVPVAGFNGRDEFSYEVQDAGGSTDIAIATVQVGNLAHPVTTMADSGPGSLRQALVDAFDGDTIDLAGVAGQITLTTGQLTIDNDLRIVGPGASTLTISGNGASRVLMIAAGRTVVIDSLTIADGFLDNTELGGAGILSNQATLTLRRSVVEDNRLNVRAHDRGGAGIQNIGGRLDVMESSIINNILSSLTRNFVGGGGIRTSGKLVVTNSTISGNEVRRLDGENGPRDSGGGGGIYLNNAPSAEIISSTITMNRVELAGGTAWNQGGGGIGSRTRTSGHVRIANSIIVGNFSNQEFPEISGRVNSLGHVLYGPSVQFNSVGPRETDTFLRDALLAPLAHHGGPLPIHHPLRGSPAIDGGVVSGGLDSDQRGTSRTFDGTGDGVARADIGAVEFTVVARDDEYFVDEDQVLVVPAQDGLLFNDEADGRQLTASLLQQAGNGTVVLNPDGSFVYTPAADFFGVDKFIYRTNLSPEFEEPATVSISVIPKAEPPVAVDDQFIFPAGVSSTVNVANGLLVNDSDGDGNELRAVLVDGPSGGQLTLNNDGSFEFVPNAGFSGSDSFTYQADELAFDGFFFTSVTNDLLDLEIDAVRGVFYAIVEWERQCDDGLICRSSWIGRRSLERISGSSFDTIYRSRFEEDTILGIAVHPVTGDVYWTDYDRGSIRRGNYEGFQIATILDGLSAPKTLDMDWEDGLLYWFEEGPNVIRRATLDGSDVETVIQLTGEFFDFEVDADADRLYWIESGVVRTATTSGDGAQSLYTAEEIGAWPTVLTLNSLQEEIYVGARPLGGSNGDDWSIVRLDYDGVASPVGFMNNLREQQALAVEPTIGFLYHKNSRFRQLVRRGIDATGASNTATVTIVVAAQDAPTAVDDSFVATEDETLTIDASAGVLANDFDDGDDSLVVVEVQAPANGQLSLNANGSFNYLPNANFFGVDVFRYHVSDGTTNSNVATVSITVSGTDDSPIAMDDQYIVPIGEQLVVERMTGVLQNDRDLDGDPLVARIVSEPANGVVTLNLDGSFTYVANDRFVGIDRFSYVAADGNGESDPSTVFVQVGDLLVDIAMAVVINATVGDVRDVLPASERQIAAGESYFVELWIQDVGLPGVGLAGGSVDLSYATAPADVVGLSHGQTFNLLPSGRVDDAAGLVDDFGGGSFLANVGVAPQWARLGYVEVLATGAGEVTFSLDRGALEFSRFGQGFVDWERVNLSDTITVQQIGSTVRIEAVVVRSPSETDAGGEIEAVPASAGFLHEWEAFWVEVWGSTPAGSDAGIAGATFDLVYNTDVATAARIEYGPAFGAGQSGTIDDAAGIVTDIGASATRGDVGDDRPVLLARMLFEPTAGDQAEVDAAGHRVGPYDLDIRLTNVRTAATTTEIGPAPQTELWAVIYDVDDSDAVNFGDFSFFAAAFELTVGDAEPPLIWWADFDKSGLVDFGDFSFFTANLLADKNSGAVTFPDNYPEAWRPAAPAPGQAPEAAAAAAAAGDLEVQLVARLSLGPDDTLAALPESLSTVSDAQTYFVEVWIRDDAAGAPGITGGRVDLQYTTGAADVLTATNSDQYNVFVSSSVDEPAGLVRGLGGGTFDAGVASGDQWARLGYVQLTATGDGPIRFTLSPGDLQLSRFGAGNIPWDEVSLGSLSLNSTPADLTGNGFVDFQDLTILLANWNQDVSAAEGNLVDAGGTPVNFQDLTVLLAAWTGPGGAASPQAATAAAVGGDSVGDGGNVDSLVAVGDASYSYGPATGVASYTARRATARARPASGIDGRIGRLQAAAVDRVLAEEVTRREVIFARRGRRRP